MTTGCYSFESTWINLIVHPLASRATHGISFTVLQTSASHYVVSSRASSAMLVAIPQQYREDWELRGAPLAKHVLVDGYANGWLLPAGSYRFTVDYHSADFAASRLLPILVLGSTLLLGIYLAIARRLRPSTQTVAGDRTQQG